MFHLCLFGTFTVVAEFRFEPFTRWFRFMGSFLGLGLFYLFVFTLAWGTETYELITAIVFASVVGHRSCLCARTTTIMQVKTPDRTLAHATNLYP